MSLGGTLLGVALLAMLGIALASIGTTHTRLMSHSSMRKTLTNAARSVVEQAIAQAFEGSLNATPTLSVEQNGVKARLTFDPDEAADLGIPRSYDNLLGRTSLSSDTEKGVIIPAATLRVVGVAEGAGQTREVEAYIYVPPFPYALASAGEIRAPGGLVVGELFAYPPSGTAIDPEKMLAPADIGTSSTSTQSVNLGAGTRITGNIESRGAVVVPEDRAVWGELRTNLEKVVIPDFDVTEYDPVDDPADPGDIAVTTSSLPTFGAGKILLTGSYRHQGDLVIPDSVSLKNAFLYVDGNLTLSQGLNGQGVVAATGGITVQGGTSLSASGLDLALVCGGRLTLVGSQPSTDTFHGVLYAGGGIDARRVAVVGTLIAGRSDQPVDLDGVTVFEKPGEAGPIPAMAVDTMSGPGIALGDRLSFDEYRQNTIFQNNSQYPGTLMEMLTSPTPDGATSMLRVWVNLVNPGPPQVLEWRLQPLDGSGGPSGPALEGTGTEGQFFDDVGEAMPLVGWPTNPPVLNGSGWTIRVACGVLQTVAEASVAPPVNPAIVLQRLSEVTPLQDRARILRWEER